MTRLETELHRRGIELIDFNRFVLRCEKCGQVFSPNMPAKRGYWRCPNGCNTK